jgi:hypothetical protein
MIFYGWRSKAIPLSDLGVQSCPRCGTTRPFRAFLSYKYFHLYWIFGTVYNRKYLAACTVCSQGTQIDPSQIGPAASEDPVPFMQKWGLGVFAVIIVGIIAVVALGH